jgi:hypothetical protein
LAVVVPILVVLVAACSDKTNGQAVPGDSTAETTTTRGGTPTSRTTSGRPTTGDSPLADQKPCALLSSSGASEMGVSGQQGNERKVGSARRCTWRITGATIKDSFNIEVGLWDTVGLKDLPSGTPQDPVPTVGKHEAVWIKDVAGCTVMMGVTEKSRVDTSANGGSVDKACELAMQLAKLVEPELP